MTEPAPEETPAVDAPAETEPTTETPPWGDDFDPARAWSTIQKLREREKELSKVTPLTPDAQQKLSEYDRLVEASKSDLERAQEERDRWQTEADRWRTSSVTSRIEALAAPDFAYPADAVAKLDPAAYLDAGGVIDEAAIRRDLAKVLEERPNWRRQVDEPAPKSRVPAPNPAQGSGGGGNAPVDPRQEFAALLQSQFRQ